MGVRGTGQGRAWYNCGDCDPACGFRGALPHEAVRWNIHVDHSTCDLGADADDMAHFDYYGFARTTTGCLRACATHVLKIAGANATNVSAAATRDVFPFWAVTSQAASQQRYTTDPATAVQTSCRCARPSDKNTRSCEPGGRWVAPLNTSAVWKGTAVAGAAGLGRGVLRNEIRMEVWQKCPGPSSDRANTPEKRRTQLHELWLGGMYASKAELQYYHAVLAEYVTSPVFRVREQDVAIFQGHLKMWEPHVVRTIRMAERSGTTSQVHPHALDDLRPIKVVENVYIKSHIPVPQSNDHLAGPADAQSGGQPFIYPDSNGYYVFPLQSFEGVFTSLEEITSVMYVKVAGSGGLSLRGFKSLKRIRQHFILKSTKLSSLEGLDGLEIVGGNFELSSLTVASFNGLGSLREIHGSLRILWSTLAAPKPTTCTAGVVQSRPAPFAHWGNLTRVRGHVHFHTIVLLNTFAGLGLKEIGGCLVIQEVDVPPDDVSAYAAFKSLASVGMELTPTHTPPSSDPLVMAQWSNLVTYKEAFREWTASESYTMYQQALVRQCRDNSTPIILAQQNQQQQFAFPGTLEVRDNVAYPRINSASAIHASWGWTNEAAVTRLPSAAVNSFFAAAVLVDDGMDLPAYASSWLATPLPLAAAAGHAAGSSAWFILDLGATESVSAFQIRNAVNMPHFDFGTAQFRVDGSLDNLTWQLALEGRLEHSRDLVVQRLASPMRMQFARFTAVTHHGSAAALGFFKAVYPPSSRREQCGAGERVRIDAVTQRLVSATSVYGKAIIPLPTPVHAIGRKTVCVPCASGQYQPATARHLHSQCRAATVCDREAGTAPFEPPYRTRHPPPATPPPLWGIFTACQACQGIKQKHGLVGSMHIACSLSLSLSLPLSVSLSLCVCLSRYVCVCVCV